MTQSLLVLAFADGRRLKCTRPAHTTDALTYTASLGLPDGAERVHPSHAFLVGARVSIDNADPDAGTHELWIGSACIDVPDACVPALREFFAGALTPAPQRTTRSHQDDGA